MNIVTDMFSQQMTSLTQRTGEIASTTYQRILSSGSGIFNQEDPLSEEVNLFLVQTVIIIGMCRFIGLFGSYLKQPKVIFEIIGGIILGPSAIGKNQQYLNRIFRSDTLSYLSLVANVGLLLYLFVVGMELDILKLQTHARRAGSVALMGMAVPFALGIGISREIFNVLQGSDPKYADVKFSSFYVFIGTAMSITAFPVLARILKESGLIYSRAGALTMGAAALNDAVAWCLLILAISIAKAGDMNIAGYVFGVVVGLGMFLLIILRPILDKIVRYLEALNSKVVRSNLFAFTLMLVFMCAWTTALLGLDVIFGAFMFGLCIPRDTLLFKDCNEFIEEFVLTVTLPIYFALSGLKTDVTQINTPQQGAMVVLVCTVASFGKFIGAGGTAYLSGVSIRESSAVAVLMNTRGLVELIVLNLGLEANILSTRTFSVMVIMCLFTTFITNPLVEYIYPAHLRIPASDPEDKNKHLMAKDDEDEVGTIAISVTTDIVEVSRKGRVGLVVDRLEHLQGIMDLLVCFEPFHEESNLSVTIMKFEEPSFTDRDQFIGLHEDRLISITQESTDIRSLLYPDLTKPLPQLLPLSMFAKTLGATVEVYDIKGDPHEFPSELRQLASTSSDDLIIVPWRPSQYLERFIWGSLRKAVCPIALFVQVEVPVPSLPEGRQRGNSILSNTNHSSGIYHTNDKDIELKRQSGEFNRSGILYVSNGSMKLSGEFMGRHDRLKRVLVIITGSYSDISIFCCVLRFLETSTMNITVLLSDGRRSYPDPVKIALTAFRKAITNCPNIKLVKLDGVLNTDTEGLYREVVKQPYDLFIHSYIDPETAICELPLHSSNSNVTPRARLARARTITGALVQTFLPTQPDVIDYRRAIGVPEAAILSDLTHPELGCLGDKVYDGAIIPNLLIFHEPLHTSVKRKNSIITVASTGGSVDATVIAASPSYASLFGHDDSHMGGAIDKIPFSHKSPEKKTAATHMESNAIKDGDSSSMEFSSDNSMENGSADINGNSNHMENQDGLSLEYSAEVSPVRKV